MLYFVGIFIKVILFLFCFRSYISCFFSFVILLGCIYEFFLGFVGFIVFEENFNLLVWIVWYLGCIVGMIFGVENIDWLFFNEVGVDGVVWFVIMCIVGFILSFWELMCFGSVYVWCL